MKIRFIGDIHGDIETWKKITSDCDNSIQLGDFGAGFIEIPLENDVCLSHKFIRGNHDNPEICRKNSRWIEDGYYDEKHRIMFVGGALSIDKNLRTPYKDWWPDEELSYVEFQNLIDKYVNLKPEVMVTHDCPKSIYSIFPYKNYFPSITIEAFEYMFFYHKPKLWLFGHHHENKNKIVEGTQFICVDINNYVDVDFPEYV